MNAEALFRWQERGVWYSLCQHDNGELWLHDHGRADDRDQPLVEVPLAGWLLEAFG